MSLKPTKSGYSQASNVGASIAEAALLSGKSIDGWAYGQCFNSPFGAVASLWSIRLIQQ